MTVPIPLKAWEMLMRISEYRGGPQTIDVRDGYKLRTSQHTSDEWVSSSLKRTKSVSDDEDGHAKPSKRLCLDTRNSNQRANSIQAKTPDEHSLVRIMTKDPRSVSQRRKRISTETSISSTATLVDSGIHTQSTQPEDLPIAHDRYAAPFESACSVYQGVHN